MLASWSNFVRLVRRRGTGCHVRRALGSCGARHGWVTMWRSYVRCFAGTCSRGGQQNRVGRAWVSAAGPVEPRWFLLGVVRVDRGRALLFTGLRRVLGGLAGLAVCGLRFAVCGLRFAGHANVSRGGRDIPFRSDGPAGLLALLASWSNFVRLVRRRGTGCHVRRALGSGSARHGWVTMWRSYVRCFAGTCSRGGQQNRVGRAWMSAAGLSWTSLGFLNRVPCRTWRALVFTPTSTSVLTRRDTSSRSRPFSLNWSSGSGREAGNVAITARRFLSIVIFSVSDTIRLFRNPERLAQMNIFFLGFIASSPRARRVSHAISETLTGDEPMVAIDRN